MPLTPFPVTQFGGLSLADDTEEVGASSAIDMMNIDLDRRGRIRTRDGYDNFTSVAAARDVDSVAPFYRTTTSVKQLLASVPNLGATGIYTAYSSAGAAIASQNVTGGFGADFVRFGGPGAEVIYAASAARPPSSWSAVTNDVFKWDGSAWGTANGVRLGGLGTFPYALEVQAVENRLVGAFGTSQSSRVGFSNPGTPETWDTNNFVDLTPGDGEIIMALVSWREMVFAFKETKYFIFTGNSAGGTGTPIFNYRPVYAGVGAAGRACATVTPNGVYFLSRRGIYRTTGGDPTLISRAIDPIFRGNASPTFTGGILNHAAIDVCALAWHDERLYFAYPSGSSTVNDRLLVYDPEIDQWILWNIPAARMTSFRVSDQAELIFSYASGTNHIGRSSSSYTNDDGTAIAAYYQSGFYPPAPGMESTSRLTRLWGIGTPTFNIFTDHATSDPLSRGGTVTLGTSPQIAKGYHLKSYQGELYSHKISSTTGAWSLNRLEHDMAYAYQPQ